jgi:hypothetical protein
VERCGRNRFLLKAITKTKASLSPHSTRAARTECPKCHAAVGSCKTTNRYRSSSQRSVRITAGASKAIILTWRDHYFVSSCSYSHELHVVLLQDVNPGRKERAMTNILSRHQCHPSLLCMHRLFCRQPLRIYGLVRHQKPHPSGE